MVGGPADLSVGRRLPAGLDSVMSWYEASFAPGLLGPLHEHDFGRAMRRRAVMNGWVKKPRHASYLRVEIMSDRLCVMIATPTHASQVTSSYLLSIAELIRVFERAEPRIECEFLLFQNALVAQSRNLFASKFLEA